MKILNPKHEIRKNIEIIEFRLQNKSFGFRYSNLEFPNKSEA